MPFSLMSDERSEERREEKGKQENEKNREEGKRKEKVLFLFSYNDRWKVSSGAEFQTRREKAEEYFLSCLLATRISIFKLS
jgi:hypothetical protein